jgi:aspartyl-tRNA(Asn)/glutamyl-tRNA(Gln) amidotransferase subunit B
MRWSARSVLTVRRHVWGLTDEARSESSVAENGAMSGVEYEPVIGLEIHVQLYTRTKMFCGCELSFGEPPNTRTCPVCLGLPGSLPVANARAVHFGLMIGMALGCELAPRSIFHRKNYFYPDLPKGYQISQYDEPLCRGGHLGDVRIHRVHLEEDAAKLVHVGASGRIHGSDASIVDFNRGGTPLAEIVTEPDLRSGVEAREWLTLLRTTLRQLGVSDVNMEEGSLRCDANISVRPVGTRELGVKTELKNMNSFRFIERGIRAEVARQERILGEGGQVVQETLHFDPASERITSLRSKEEAHDYRYFPEPDLLPVAIERDMLEAARAAMPELPAARAERLEQEVGLSADSARQLAFRAELGDYFEAALAAGADPAPPAQALANWVAGDLVGRLGDGETGGGAGGDPSRSRVQPAALAVLVGLVSAKRISVGAGRQVLDRLVAEGGGPLAIVQAEGLEAMGGEEDLAAIVAAALAANADAAERVKGGNAKAIGPIVGHVMRETKGRADGGEVTRLVNEQLGL